MSGPGIANATRTRIDSASKHQVACRVDYEHMLSWINYDHTVMQKEKMKWCMHKDDLVLGCSKPLRENEPQRTSARNKAYPSVVVTLALMQAPAVNYLVALYHNCFNFTERDAFILDVERSITNWVGKCENVEFAKKQIQEMPEFYFVGVSVGMAYAHPNSGDNVATSMIGGLKTILNGAFPIQAGDPIQWYWDGERPCFDRNGKRIPDRIVASAGRSITSEDVERFLKRSVTQEEEDLKRRKYYERGNGTYSMPEGNTTGKARVAYPKPFRYQDEFERVGDRIRVFGKALTSARAYEMVDVMISRQSL